MNATTNYLAIDLGASSGRGVVGSFDGSRLSLREVHRFANTPVTLPTGLHWDTPRLYEEVKRALGLAAKEAGAGGIAGMGIDTWGVDYGLLSSAGELLGLPHHYRDGRTNGMMEAAFGVMPRELIYARTGIQFMALNTIFQLMAEKRANDGRLGLAKSLLFTPDLLSYWLTGVQRSEASIASTSQLYDTSSKSWVWELVDALGLPRGIFPEVAAPGTPVGPLLDRVAEETGARGATVIAPAGHDTGCAVAAVPARGEGWAYISSGTWSLVGRELDAPVRTPAALAANFTNEGGVSGTTRFHKNVAGLWLLQECQRVWASQGRAYTFEQLAGMAQEGEAFRTIVDPDAEAFAEPGDMPSRIRDAASRAGHPAPGTDSEVVRCILESLALKTRAVIESLEALTGPVDRIHVVGGGSRNEVLCQWTADACGKPVFAGPVEATAAGNVMVQAMAHGQVSSLAQVREVVRASVEVRTYEPRPGGGWDEMFALLQSAPA